MKKYYVLFAILGAVFLINGKAFAEEVTTPRGVIQLGAAGKWMYSYTDEDSHTLTTGNEEFTTSMLELRIEGLVTDNISYDVELIATLDPETGNGGLAGNSSPGESGVMGVRQASISFKDIIPNATVKLGTFTPSLSNYMDREVNNLDLIYYPLLNNATRMNTGGYGNRPAARDLGIWQESGASITVAMPYMVEFELGVYNGTQPGNQANMNENVAMASSVKATFTPFEKFSASLGYFGEEFNQAFPGHAQGAKRQLTMWFLYCSYSTDVLEVTVDYASAIVPRGQLDRNDEFQNLAWEGWQVTLGYWVLPDLEILTRYEQIDPNTANRLAIPSSKYDESAWTTLGMNYRLNSNAEVSLNYIFKDETGADEVDNDNPGADIKESAQDNDTLLIQVQFWQ
jgi:hypothetical protein